jgi:Saf4/Yju2 protein
VFANPGQKEKKHAWPVSCSSKFWTLLLEMPSSWLFGEQIFLNLCWESFACCFPAMSTRRNYQGVLGLPAPPILSMAVLLVQFQGQHPLRDRARKLDQGILIIRFEMPFNVWCEGCNHLIGKVLFIA